MIWGLKIRPMRPGEETAVSELVKNVFDEYVGGGYSAEGIKTFHDYIRPEAVAERLNQEGHHVFTARWKKTLVGALAIRDTNHVSLMFVDKRYHGKGISRKMFRKTVKLIRKHYHSVREITVNSSPYAFPVYCKLGFCPLGGEQEQNGIRFIPMSYKIR